jgi:oligopeptide transport system substrate-binding protein
VNNPYRSPALILLLMAMVFSGCASTEQATPDVIVSNPTSTIPPLPTERPTDVPEPTLPPSPTPLPGTVVIPIDSYSEGIPWLPYDPSAVPSVYYIAFNCSKPPFDNPLVRQAFAAAVDKDVLVDITVDLYASAIFDPRPATNVTPPEILGRDVFNEIGIRYDPASAAELLKQAGYEDSSAFPAVTILVNATGSIAVGYNIKMADTMAEMWKDVLGVDVKVEYVENFNVYKEMLQDNQAEMIRVYWAADFNDPDNFLRTLFQTGSESNFGNFSNPEFDELVQQAAEIADPTQRQLLYLEAERILCEQEAGAIPIYHATIDVR